METESESNLKEESLESRQSCFQQDVSLPSTSVSSSGVSNSKKRKKTLQQRLEEQEKRRERELKKLSDCWSLNNKPTPGPRSRRSSLGPCSKVQSDFINYENNRHFFDGLVSLPLSSRKGRSASAGGNFAKTKSVLVSFHGIFFGEKSFYIIFILFNDNKIKTLVNIIY